MLRDSCDTGIRHLYRGVSVEMHETQGGVLRPKQFVPFTRAPEYGRDEWNNCFWGESSVNAVIEHQRHQAGYPTSGVSTTPHLERARFYATRGGKLLVGYVYVIDRDLCHSHGVTLYVVNDIVPQPSVVEDDEVILVAQDFRAIPADVVIDVVGFCTWLPSPAVHTDTAR
jgi:hypothetical protein